MQIKFSFRLKFLCFCKSHGAGLMFRHVYFLPNCSPVVGGMEINLDIEKMSQLVNLQANLVLKDCLKESIDREELL